MATLQFENWRDLSTAERQAVLRRPAMTSAPDIESQVEDILNAVRADGDAALTRFSRDFDQVGITDFRVSDAEFDAAERSVSAKLIAAIDQAFETITRFHEATVPQPLSVTTIEGVTCERQIRPIDRVGLYVPAGSAPLPSTAMMLAIPAKIAGCPTRVMCTPPNREGKADPSVLVVAKRAGIDAVFKVGGAQAIAALAYGTESIPKVDRIFGPGNAWVTKAKTQVAGEIGGPAIDLPAGPSEVMVIADGDADPAFVAADLLAQAEHDVMAQVILVSNSAGLIADTQDQVEKQLAERSREPIIQKSLTNGTAIRVDSIDEAIAICNDYAPEHLILNLVDASERVADIRNAGSVFVGPWTPESLGDYCSGTNHVLPTYGAARALSGLSVGHFTRSMTVQQASRSGLGALAATTQALADAEGLDAHAYAVTVRLNQDGSS